MIALVFSDTNEAKTMFKKVTARKASSGAQPFRIIVLSSSNKSRTAKSKTSSSKKKTAKGGKIDKSMISGPTAGSFRHVAHMGYDAEKGFISDNVDPSWQAILNSLEAQGVDRSVIAKDMDFIKGYMRDAQAQAQAQAAAGGGQKPPKPPPPAPRHKGQDSISASSPTPPRAPAPPPPPSRGHPPPRAPPARSSRT